MTLSKEEYERRSSIVANDCNGIIPYNEVFYIHSLYYSSHCSIKAYNRFIKELKNDPDPFDLVSNIQESLAHAAGVSKFIFPSPMGKKSQSKLKQARAQKLRNSIKISLESPLSDRRLRDSWEHFDERLDNFLLETVAGDFLPDPIIGSSKKILPTHQVFKLIDPFEHRFILLNQEFEYLPILKEIEKIHNWAVEALEKKRL